jgi:DNA repair photolyase
VLRPVSNPPNPWISSQIEYLDEVPEARLEVYEDHTKNILAENDSPDVGFRFSVNPYRGCYHACAYCMSGDTLVSMADGTTRPLRDLRVGDAIYGTERCGDYRRYVHTEVLAHWETSKLAYRLRLDDGTELTASADHRFLTRRGWKYVTDTENGLRRRPHLTTNDKLLGFGGVAPAPVETSDYARGYLTGMVRGDALLGVFRYQRVGRSHGDQYQFRLALADGEALQRTRHYLLDQGIFTRKFVFQPASLERREMVAIRTGARHDVERIQALIAWPTSPSSEWDRGFLAGIFDAEGSCSCGVLRISNTNQRIIDETARIFRSRGFSCAIEQPGKTAVAMNVRLRGGLRARMQFFQWAQPAISRKRDFAGMAIKSNAPLGIVSIEETGIELPMFDITTGTGDFLANGVVSHNCYARPGHEYLSFGAGTDFERKIVIKPRAPELLREAFEKKSWQGDTVVFSGVTDCYQPLEASLELTRGCLQVCAEYRNPVGIITKAPLIERDLDVLLKLQEVASAHVMMSIPFWNADHARAIEPFVATPQRRMKTLGRLAAAGLKVGVMVAPMIPGLSDEDIVRILEAAAEAGATTAGTVFLRLPGSVKQVFEERVRAALPLRADKILHKVREARGGKLYDSRAFVRQKGEGPYAQSALALFEATCKRLGINERDECVPHAPTFQRPVKAGDQLKLF